MNETIKVLLIDDDEDDVILTEDLLGEISSRDYQLSWSETFDDGFEKLFSGGFDVYLIDYRLGVRTGIDLLQKIKDEGLNRATIILTGQGDEEVDNLAMQMGAYDYLIKGEFASGELDRAIRYAIELRKGKDALRLQAEILKNVHDAVFYIREDGTILDWNDGAVRIFETPPSEAIGTSIFGVCPFEKSHPFLDRILPLVRAAGAAEEVIRCKLKSGKEIIIRAKVTSMNSDGKTGFVICASDISQQKRLESEILRISENEQRRIGQDIHDDLCSQLSGIGLMTKVLENQLRVEHEKEAELLANISEMVAEAGFKARRLAKGLVPATLEAQGLSGAIHELAEQSRGLFGVNCKATVSGKETIDTLDSTIGIQLYRIAQEATTNAMKHSDAELVQIRLCEKNGSISLEVEDDGKGIAENMISSGLGMMTMRQRAEMINADFALTSLAGKGTRICCNVSTPPNTHV